MNPTTCEPVLAGCAATSNVEDAPQVKRVRIGDLRAHPRQGELFPDLPPSELAALVADLRKNGQREPIRILPDGTVLCGHQRVRAARELGWDSVQAIVVNFDNEDDALLLVVSDNVRRRQLGPIALARIYDTLSRIEWAEGRQPGTDLRDEIAGRIGGKCGRTLDRYRRLLRLPWAILQAVESGQLAMSVGLRILRLPSNVRDEIAAEIDRGEEADQVVARHLVSNKAAEVDRLREQYRRMLGELRTGMRMLDRRLGDVVGYGPDSDDAITIAERACKFLRRVIAAEKKRKEKCARRLARRLKRLART